VNNVSTHEGGGIGINDTPDVRVFNNTIMKNQTTATAVTSTGIPAPAGLSTSQNSSALQATLPGGAPVFSNPLVFNNIFWDNRAGTRGPGAVIGLGAAGDTTPIDYWDLGVADGTGVLAPTNSVIQQDENVHAYTTSGTNSALDPAVISPYDISVNFNSWRTNPNFIGAILVAVDLPPSLLGDYHILASSSANDLGAASKSGVNAPANDIDGDARPAGAGFDSGADERLSTLPAPPSVSGVSATPNPTGGVNSISLSATASSASSVTAAEWFRGADPGVGNGTPMTISGSGPWGLAATIDVSGWAPGSYTLNVRAQNAGGWSAPASTNLVVDTGISLPPSITGVSATPNPTAGAVSASLSATANATALVTAAEWFTGADPGVGNGTPMTIGGSGPWSLSANIDVSSWANGYYTLNVRALNEGGWGATASTVLVVESVATPANLYFSTDNNNSPPGADGSGDDSDLYSWDGGSLYTRVIDGISDIGLYGGANVDGLTWVDATHFYLSFTANVNPPGPVPTTQNEDILYYSAGTWSLIFDGSAFGLSGENIDALSVVDATHFYVSFSDQANLGGSVGNVEDEDIVYYDNGTWSLIFDGSANGLPHAGADIDGLTVVDATHFYVSFNGQVNVSGLADTVWDEDVLYYNNGVWSLYFDGNNQGLSSSLFDLDAISVTGPYPRTRQGEIE
jgi:hypothetical protein